MEEVLGVEEDNAIRCSPEDDKEADETVLTVPKIRCKRMEELFLPTNSAASKDLANESSTTGPLESTRFLEVALERCDFEEISSPLHSSGLSNTGTKRRYGETGLDYNIPITRSHKPITRSNHEDNTLAPGISSRLKNILSLQKGIADCKSKDTSNDCDGSDEDSETNECNENSDNTAGSSSRSNLGNTNRSTSSSARSKKQAQSTARKKIVPSPDSSSSDEYVASEASDSDDSYKPSTKKKSVRTPRKSRRLTNAKSKSKSPRIKVERNDSYLEGDDSEQELENLNVKIEKLVELPEEFGQNGEDDDEKDYATTCSSDGDGEEVALPEKVEGKRGIKLWCKGYGYLAGKTTHTGDTRYFKCHRTTCRGTAIWRSGRLYSGDIKHNHSRKKDAEIRECDEFREELRKVCDEHVMTRDKHEIYDLVAPKYKKASMKLTFEIMRNLMKRWQFKRKHSQENVTSLGALSSEILQHAAEGFYSGTVYSKNGFEAVILGNSKFIEDAFTTSKLMYMDTNFDCGAEIPSLRYILMLVGVVYERMIPIGFVLMENKSEELYEAVFRHIKDDMAPTFNPSFIMCDFDQELHAALRRIYNETNIQGHFFHYVQAIFRKACNLGLIQGEETEQNQMKPADNKEESILMLYYTLPLLPENCITTALEHLREIQPKHFTQFSSYFEEQWMKRVGTKHLSVHQQTGRTNALLDAYCRKLHAFLKQFLNTGNMSPLPILDALERQYLLVQKDFYQLQSGKYSCRAHAKLEKLFNPLLRKAWDDLAGSLLTVPQFMQKASEFMADTHYLLKHWHNPNGLPDNELVISVDLPFVQQLDNILEYTVRFKPQPELMTKSPNFKSSTRMKTRGTNMVWHEGYSYNVQRITNKPNGKQVRYLVCRHKGCNGTIIMEGERAKPGRHAHNHPPSDVNISEKVANFKVVLRALVDKHRTMNSIQLYKLASEQEPEGAKEYSYKLSQHAISRRRSILTSQVPDAPSMLSGLDDVLHSPHGEYLTITNNGTNFYSGTVKAPNGQCAVVFGETQLIQDFFKASQNWIIDSNYRGASQEPPMNHVMFLLSIFNENIFPIAYILMEDRSDELYTAVFNYIRKDLAPGIYPTCILCDYDEMLHNAIKNVYSEATLQGTLFHFAQAVYRKAWILGIVQQAENNPDIQMTLLQYYAIPLLPLETIETGLAYLQQIQPKGFEELLRYVKSEWMDRIGPSHLSTYMQSFRSNNALDLLQKIFNSLLEIRPPIFQVIEAFKKMHSLSTGDLELLRKGGRRYVRRIGHKFDSLVHSKINTLWKNLKDDEISLEVFFNACIDCMENLHFVFNSWDMHDKKLDIKLPLLVEDVFVLHTDEMVKASMPIIGRDEYTDMIKNDVTDTKNNIRPMEACGIDDDIEQETADEDGPRTKDAIIKEAAPKKKRTSFWQDGYTYVGNRTVKTQSKGAFKQYLKCRQKGCRATAMIMDGEFRIGKTEHNHLKNLDGEQIEEFKRNIKSMIQSQPLSVHEIYDLAATMNPQAAALCPFTACESTFRRWRNERFDPVSPRNLGDIDRILRDSNTGQMVQTMHGSFYAGTVTLTNGRCAVVLAEDRFIKQITSSKHLYIEATYRCAPRDAFVDHGMVLFFVIGWQVVPVAYILMEDNSEELCSAVFKFIKETLVPKFNPSFIMCDYNSQLHTVLGQVYFDANIQGCFLHYAQAIYRKAYTMGLVQRAKYDEACAKTLKQYYSLVLLPAESMFEALQYLNVSQPKGFVDLWNYVKTQWFDRVGSEHMSMYRQPYRCNASLECFHKYHNGILTPHPGIIDLIKHLKKSHDSTCKEHNRRLGDKRIYHTVLKSKQLFNINLKYLWNQFDKQLVMVDSFLVESTELLDDLHYLFTVWEIQNDKIINHIPFMREVQFVLDSESQLTITTEVRKVTTKRTSKKNSTKTTRKPRKKPEEAANGCSKVVSLPVMRKDSEILWHDGYGYYVAKTITNATGNKVTYAKCRTPNCRVRASITNGQWKLYSNVHNHVKDLFAEQDAAFKQCIMNMVRDQPLPLKEIYNLAASLNPDTAERLPYSRMRNLMARWKRSISDPVMDSAVGSLSDLAALLENDSGVLVMQLTTGSFFSGIVTAQDGLHALVFAEHEFVQTFSSSDCLFIDANYRCTPRDPFVHQILILFGVYNTQVLPIVYVLMESNSEYLYTAVFRYLKETLVPDFHPEYVICDYDSTLHNSIHQVYSEANIQGCFFHYTQAIYRKAFSLGLMDKIQNENENYQILMQYYSLPLLSNNNIELAFQQLSQSQPNMFKNLWLYVKKQWIQQIGTTQLSVFEQPHRTNGCIEATNRKLNDLVKDTHPKMFDLLTQLMKLHQIVRNEYDHLRKGRRNKKRVGYRVDRPFPAELKGAWRRLTDGQISIADFMQLVGAYMGGTHFVFHSWDVGAEVTPTELPNMVHTRLVTMGKRPAPERKHIAKERCSSEDEPCDEYDIDPDYSPTAEPAASEPDLPPNQPEPHLVPDQTEPEAATDTKKLCFLCNIQKRTHACVPCGHLSYCGNCFPDVSRIPAVYRICPVCSAHYSFVLEIHF